MKKSLSAALQQNVFVNPTTIFKRGAHGCVEIYMSSSTCAHETSVAFAAGHVSLVGQEAVWMLLSY